MACIVPGALLMASMIPQAGTLAAGGSPAGQQRRSRCLALAGRQAFRYPGGGP
jgi:hypothetical protein